MLQEESGSELINLDSTLDIHKSNKKPNRVVVDIPEIKSTKEVDADEAQNFHQLI